MGSTYSYVRSCFPSNNPSTIDTIIDRILDELVIKLQENEKLFQDQDIDVSSSLQYLQRPDVRKQTKEICTQLNADKISGRIESLLGLAFAEIHVEANTKTYELNLWPCSTCACVTVN